MPPPRKLKTQKKARPESCLLYWGCRRTRHLDRKLFREDCGGTAGFCRIGAKRRPCPQQPASSNSQPRPTKRPPEFPDRPTVREGAFVGEPQVPTTFERSGRPAAAVGEAVCGRRPRGVCGGTVGSCHIGAKRNSRPQAADFQRKSVSPNKKSTLLGAFCLVGEDGFEPSKSVTTDLQSAPFGRSGILPYINPTEAGSFCGAGGRLRTPDLLITNQLLYLLSYTSLVSTNAILS